MKKPTPLHELGPLQLVILVLSLFVLSLLAAEQHPESRIQTAEDAIGWGFTTITTVGYGDLYPVTTVGRIIAVSLMLTGVSLFGNMSGVIASFFLGDRKVAVPAEDASSDDLKAELEKLREENQRQREAQSREAKS